MKGKDGIEVGFDENGLKNGIWVVRVLVGFMFKRFEILDGFEMVVKLVLAIRFVSV